MPHQGHVRLLAARTFERGAHTKCWVSRVGVRQPIDRPYRRHQHVMPGQWREKRLLLIEIDQVVEMPRHALDRIHSLGVGRAVLEGDRGQMLVKVTFKLR